MNIPLTPIRFLRYAEQQFPGKTAVVCRDLRFTYAQFAERACRLAGAMRKRGVKPGERVAFLSMNCHRLLEAYYGVLEAGAVLLPLNIRLAPHESLPKTGTGKILKKELRKKYWAGQETIRPEFATKK